MPLKKFGGQILKNARQILEFGRQIFLKAYFKIRLQNLYIKAEIIFYVDSENFMKNIETLLSSIIFNEVNCLNVTN